MQTRYVHLTEHVDHFIETGIASGCFSNASEVVREGLRLLEQREQGNNAIIEWLRAAAKEGFDQLDRGEYVTLNSEQARDSFLDHIHKDISERLAQGSRGRDISFSIATVRTASSTWPASFTMVVISPVVFPWAYRNERLTNMCNVNRPV